jgi:succinoglycan biosynthesis transport protein ExoP
LGLVVVVTIGTYVYYDRQPDQFSASTDVYLVDSAGALTGGGGISERELANQARLLKTRPVARRVAAKIGFRGDPSALLSSVTVQRSPDADFVTVTATAKSGTLAADLANAFAQSFVEQRTAARKQAALTNRVGLERQYRELPRADRESAAGQGLAQEIRQLKAVERLESGSGSQLDEAVAPGAPFAPDPGRNAIFAFALSLLLGALAAYATSRLDRRVRHVQDVRNLYDTSLLASIPRHDVFSSATDMRSPLPPEIMETFRMLRSTIDLAETEASARVILVTSAVSGEGKSTVASNLAVAHLEIGRRVVLVEADLRRPTLASVFDTDKEPGLSDVLTHRSSAADALQPILVDVPGFEDLAATSSNGSGARNVATGSLTILTSGARTPNPAALLATAQFPEVIEHLRTLFDTIIVDSPPLVAVSDTLHILPVVDGVVLVSRLGRASQDTAARAAEILSRFPDVEILGVVANDVTAAGQEYGYADYEYSRG